MKTKVLSVIVASIILSSCAINYITWNANKRMKDVALGMSKTEVTNIMGNLFITNSSSLTTLGEKEEVLVYKSDATEEFRLKFLDNKLISWDRVHINAIVNKEQPKE